MEKINKKNKNANVKPFMVKNHLWLFINCQIENPAFDSQTKENMTLRASSFGSKCELPGPLIDKIAKCGVVDSILQVRAAGPAQGQGQEGACMAGWRARDAKGARCNGAKSIA